MKIQFRFVILTVAFLSLGLMAEEAAPVKKLWDSNAEASLLLTSGNTDVTTLGLGGATIYAPDPWTVKGKINFLTSSNAGAKNAESFNAEVRGERKLTDALSLFVQVGYLKNRFAGFNDRFGGELGLSYLVLQQGEHTLTADGGLGLLTENRTDFTNQTFATARAAVEYKWKFSSTAEFSTQIAILDNLKTMRDWRLSNINSVTAVLTEILSLKASFKVDHLNAPVAGKKGTDTATTLALVAKF